MRGFVFGGMRSRYGFTLSLVITLLAQLIMHWVGFYTLPRDAVALALANTVFCLYKEYCVGIWPPIAAHVGYNAATYIG